MGSPSDLDKYGQHAYVNKQSGLTWGPIKIRFTRIVITTILAGTLLMSLSMFVKTEGATRDVLPFATGLLGFLAGLITALFAPSQRELSTMKETAKAETQAKEANESPSG